jgi:hypothetical protein
MSDYSTINAFGGTKINTPTKSSEQGLKMPIKVMFAIAILLVFLGVILYYAPISVMILGFAISVTWAVLTVMIYYAEEKYKP